MARNRGNRGGRANQGRGAGNRPGRPGTGRVRGGGPELPVAQPGAAGAPIGASASGAVGQRRLGPASAPQGGPRGGGPGERHDRRSRAMAAMHDFHYVPGDLKRVAVTTAGSVTLVVVLYAIIRLI